MRSTALVFSCFALLLTLAPAASAAPPASVAYPDLQLEPVFTALPDHIELLQLENGLKVVLLSNPSAPMVGIYTQVRAGSAWEDARTSGMTHMLEHLLFNGSEKYTQEEQYELADRAGAYNNANTTDFYTNFMMVLPANRLETGMELQSQMLLHSVLPPEKFEKEKGIVLGEIVQSRDRAEYDTNEAIRQALYGDSALALPTLGTKSTIEHMQRDDVYEFYKTWYVPNNMTLTLAGNFDRDEALELLGTYYGTAAPGTIDRSSIHRLPHIERTTAVTRRAGDRRVVALSFEAPTYGMQDYYAYEVLTQLLTMNGSGILTRALDGLDAKERPELSYSWQRVPGFGRLDLEFELPEGADPGQCYEILQNAVVGAVEAGIRESDIRGIVHMSETETLLHQEQLRMTGIYTAETVALGGPDFFVSYLEHLRQVTAEDVSRVLTSWLVDSPCRAVLVEAAGEADDSEGGMGAMQMPAGMQMPPAMKAAMEKMARGGEAPAAGSEMPPAPVEEPAGSIAPITDLHVDRSVLQNGAVLVSQTNPDSPLMAIHLAVRGRAMIDRETAGAGALDIVHRLLMEGSAGCDKVCLAQRLRELGAVVKLVDNPYIPMDDYYTNGRFSFIRIETTAAHGLELLDLLTELIQHGAFDGTDLERVRTERITDLEQESASARREANRLLDEALYGDHPLVMDPEGTVESLRKLDFNELRLVYRRAFSPENLIFSIVGPYSHEELAARIEQLLVGRGKPAPGLPPLPITEAAQTITGSVDGEIAALRLGSIFPVDAGDEHALRLLVAVLSDRMAMDLRETRGLSYSVGATVSIDAGIGQFTAWLNPPRERVEEGRQALDEFVSTFDATTITQEDLDRIRNARLGRTMMRRISSMGQAYYLAMAELGGDIPGYLEAFTAPLEVQLDDLVTVAGKYLTPMKRVEVVVD